MPNLFISWRGRLIKQIDRKLGQARKVKITIAFLPRYSKKLSCWAIIFLGMTAISLSDTNAQSSPNATASQALVIAIPYGQTADKFYSIYPISIFINGKYHGNKTGSYHDQAATILKENQQAIDSIDGNKEFTAFSSSRRIGTFATQKVRYAQGLSCEYTFSPIGKLRIDNASGQNERNIAVLITENDKTKTCRIDTRVGEVVKNKLRSLIADNIKSFGLKLAKTSWKYVKRIEVGPGNDMIIAMTKATLSSPHLFDETAGKTTKFQTLSIFRNKNGTLTPLYLKNPDHVVYTEFIWAGDIEGDGDVEIILREAYGEFGKFVIFRIQRERLIKVFEGTEYGC